MSRKERTESFRFIVTSPRSIDGLKEAMKKNTPFQPSPRSVAFLFARAIDGETKPQVLDEG
jgi:hypothetical protein